MRPAALALTAFFVAGLARAAIYENTVTVDDEEDLFDLQQRGDISDATADTLLELIREGVDLNSSDRDRLYDLPGLSYADVDAIIEYRTAKGRIDDPTELVSAGALTAEQLIQMAPFIRIDAAKPILPVSGKLHAQGRFTIGDDVAPPALLSARLKGPENLSAGFMMFTTRRRTSSPQYDSLNDSLGITDFRYAPQLPRIFAMWAPGKAKLVVGTYTIGFGERLTLDTTRRITPRGIYLTDDFRRPNDLASTCRVTNADGTTDPTQACDQSTGLNRYITPDYTWREVFRGVAGSIEDLKVGDEGSISLYGFASYQQRSIYQYELFDRRYCDDPNDDNNDACKAPPVYINGGPGTLKYSTLNNVFDEVAGGGHVTYKPIQRLTLGVTGWGALPIFQQRDIELDFQEWSRYPTGGAFGAIGADAHLALRSFNFYLEGTRTFDRRPNGNGGGFGVEQRSTYSPKGHEFELSLRLYDPGFGTPFARPISSPDELDGLRSRNEGGVRVRWLGRLNQDWEARVRADFWVNPWSIDGIIPAGVPNLYALARLDFVGWRFFQPAVWVDVRNRNLVSNERGLCSSGTFVFTEGDPYVCGGDLYRAALRLNFAPLGKKLQGMVQGYFTWRDDFRYDDQFRNDLQIWAELRSQPVDFLQFRARTRYLNQDLLDRAYLEESVWTYFEAAWIIGRGTRLAARYDLYVWLDQRSTTMIRTPSPEHRFQLDLRYQF